MEQLLEIIEGINASIWGWPMMILLLGTHFYLTFRLKIPQRKIFTAIKLSVKKDSNSSGDVSQFEALATSLAATIGTGNIIGVATAVSLGGPGAVLWCWLTGLFGIATKYAEGLLAIRYREKTEDGRMLGGPMYALEKGLGCKWLGILFCIFTAIATFGIGNTVQANAISENLALACDGLITPEHTKMIVGFILATVVGFVIIGGVKSIAKWCTTLVPLMAALYILGCAYILFINREHLASALFLIINEAFSLKAVGGGTAGTVLMAAARYGIARGLFSNESGMGSAPIVAAAAQTRNPVRQALVSSTGTFWDTVVICAITGLVIVSSIVASPEINQNDGGMLTRTHPLCRSANSHIRHYHFCLFDHSRMELLWGKSHRIPYWKTGHHLLQNHLHLVSFCRCNHEPCTRLGIVRHHECLDGHPEPHLPIAAFQCNCQRHSILFVGKTLGRKCPQLITLYNNIKEHD